MMLNKNIKWITAMVIILGTLFTTCEMPMGLGPPVDTTPPNIFIDSPQDNTKMKAITRGNPVVLEGTWMDDINVTSLEFEFKDKWNNVIVTPSKTDYTLTVKAKDSVEGWVYGTWIAEIVIDANVATEYRIRAYALDKFGNRGMAEVNVQIDIIPPWVDGVKIQKHPNHPRFANTFIQDSNDYTAADTGSVSGKKDSLPNFEYYRRKGFDFNNSEAWRNIKYEDIDEFQNEFFRISSELIAQFNNVAATRLNIYRENGSLLNMEMIKPTGYTRDPDVNKTHLRYPYWDITSAQMTGYDNQYAGGPHYISFEIRAWSSTDWTGDDVTGYPNKDSTGQEEPGRSQRIGGTVWFPESNNPIAYIDKRLIMGATNSITLTPNTLNALDLDIYDDDLLSEIYLGLIPKDRFDTLRRDNGNKSENEFLDMLAVDGNGALRTSVMSGCLPTSNPITNLFTADGNDNRSRTLSLNTINEGEYRLIAIVKEEDKTTSNPGYTYPPAATPKWSVYPPLRIQVLAAMAPLIIVEDPIKDNAFPNLRNDGRSFTMKGYTLAGSQVNQIFIAWVPQGKAASDADTAFAAAKLPGAAWVNDLYTHAANGVQVWNIPVTNQGQEYFGATEYYKSSFTRNFDLLNDFPGGVFNNSSKINLFVIQANATNITTKNFPLLGSSAQPTVNVIGHTNNINYHDRNKDLVLRMQVGTGTDGVALKDNSFQKITDIAGGLTGLSAVSSLGGGEYQATVGKDFIAANFLEGSQRNYRYEAENILGNRAEQNKTIVMSTSPLIESILCTNGPGTYAQGEKLLFEVTFSMPVLVSGSPRLKLYFNTIPPTSASNTPTPSKYATYVTPSDTSRASNTLQFEYTVALNDESNQLKNSLAPLDLNGATLKSYYDSDAVNSLNDETTSMQRQIVKLDGVRPKVLRASFTQTGTAPSYFKRGSIITINLLCDEPVMVSGAPKIQIATNNGISKNVGLAEYSSITGNTLKFTYTVSNSDDFSEESRLTWATPWISYASGDAITDAVGNPIDFATAALPTEQNRYGAANGSYVNEMAYIKTSAPPAPTLRIYNTQAGAQNATAGALVSRDNINGQYFYIRADNISTAGSAYTVYYSLTGGSNPKTDLAGTGANRYSSSTANAIADPNYANRILSTYAPTSYQVTVWQKDRAGNESDKSTARDLTINSRPAEFVGADISLQDGSHPVGTVVPFKLSFSQKITMTASSRITLYIAGTSTGMTGSTNIAATAPASTAASSLVTVNWTVPSGIDAMKDIKITQITFTDMRDEYDNALLGYTGNTAEDTNRRPINNASSFQISRPDIVILSNNPRLVDISNGNSTTPAMPTGAGQNGALLSGSTIRLVFAEGANKIAVPLTAVAGRYITIRPYGNWAIPPVLTIEEFNSVYNFNYGTNNATYRRRLSDVDDNGLPKSGSGRGSGYNSYIKNTHGLIAGSAGNVRPNTATKMVLEFTTGLYDGNANNLRTIFNEAGWKQQKILVTSNNVKIENNNVIAITLPAALDVGRIWEVLIDGGAFQDSARNLSTAVAAGEYRFWSAGTATPVIRVDKVSYDARDLSVNGNNINRHSDLQFVTNTNPYNPNRPPIDTRVRIDCETPGADIRYNVIRTSYTLNPGQNTATSDAFTSTANTATNFFHRTDITSTNGYNTNNIGNDDAGLTANYDSEGFFNKLLSPNTVDTGTATLSNGTFPKSVLDTLGSAITITSGGSGTGINYQNYAANGARDWGTYNITGTHVIYIGEMYTQTSETNGANSRIANADTNIRLFSGRRDYIVAKAQKFNITATGDTNGPALAISTGVGMEGAYKTTLLYRNPTKGGNRARRLLVQGFDIPVMPVVAGFPLRDADTTSTDENSYNNIFSKNAWYRTATAATMSGTTPAETDNNHIWVTWEIVTDWYQKGKAFETNGNYLDNNNVNANSVTATYGGVIYRYNQAFY